MKSITCTFYIFILFFEIINATPLERLFRLKRQYFQMSTPSGSIPGASYYGIGSDPNYGSFVAKPDSASGSIIPISYNPNSGYYNRLIQQNHASWQQQPNYNTNNNNNNNRWQSSYQNNYDKNVKYDYYNRYATGSQGWYATGGNYWFNNAQSITLRPYLFMICMAIILFWK